jgi:DNA repair protein RadD
MSNKMKIFPSQNEIETAADLLVNKYKISSQLLGELFGTQLRDQANGLLRRMGQARLDRLQLTKLWIYREGPNIFSGNSSATKKLRHFLLGQLEEENLRYLFERHGQGNTRITSPSYMITPLVNKPWRAGGRWPMDFVKALGFPLIFAGVKGRQSENKPSMVEIQPKVPFPPLVDFQISLKNRMLEVLEQDGDRTKCIVTLPTGGGKTRVAVEAFIEWVEPRFNEGKYLIWIAQSEELCEQAIQCITDLWSNQEFYYPLKVYRFFGNYSINMEDLTGGVVVCSIQKIHNSFKSNNELFDYILLETGAMIIDEAHRAVSYMYDNLFKMASEIRGEDLFPVCGLTATPGRAGINAAEETAKLVKRFEAYLIKPDLDEAYTDNPLRYFREHKYLARAKHIVYRSGRKYVLSDDESIEAPDTDEKLTKVFLRRLANDEARNLIIINRLLQIPKDKPTLVYACTVEHAHFLAMILTEKGRTAGVITSDTSLTIRRGLIKRFKEGSINFLLNFGVLTTGFDAPNTEYIVICRPTTSVILYEQIVGRGLRGPRFGGTEECTIIDFADNINRLGGPLAYQRFAEDWQWDDETEESMDTMMREVAASRE